MTPKPHYRLRRLIDCPDGTRFYTKTTFKPYTLITSSVKRYAIWTHLGHDFNLYGARNKWGGYAMGWVAV